MTKEKFEIYLEEKFPTGLRESSMFTVDHFHDIKGIHVILQIRLDEDSYEVLMKGVDLSRKPCVKPLKDLYEKMGIMVSYDETAVTLCGTRFYGFDDTSDLVHAINRYYQFLMSVCNFGPELTLSEVVEA